MSNDNDTSILSFPIQIKPKGEPVSSDQLASQVRMKLTHKLNRVAKGEYELTEEDKVDICNANDVFYRNGYQLIDIDMTQL